LKVAIANLPHYHNPTPAQKLDYQKRKLSAAIDLAASTGNWDAQAMGGSAASYKQAVKGAKQIQSLRNGYTWISKNLLGGSVIGEWKAYARTKNPNAFR
jgi:hypothetical protein